MPTKTDFEGYPCLCKCPACLAGKHCGILDKNCTQQGTSESEDMTDEEVRMDDMRASAGLLDPEWGEVSLDDTSLFPNSLEPEDEIGDNNGRFEDN